MSKDFRGSISNTRTAPANDTNKLNTTPCLRKNCANFFLSELRQISTKFGNFW